METLQAIRQTGNGRSIENDLHHDEGEAPLELLRLLLDRRDHLLCSVQPLLRAGVEDELKERLHSVLRFQGGGALAVRDGSGPLNDIGELLLVESAATLVLGGAATGVGIAHGVALAADDVDGGGGAVLFQLSDPLALDALQRRSTREVETHDDGVTAFVGECAVVGMLWGSRGVLHSDVASPLACLEVGLVEIERLS